jgi:hypothetical protein
MDTSRDLKMNSFSDPYGVLMNKNTSRIANNLLYCICVTLLAFSLLWSNFSIFVIKKNLNLADDVWILKVNPQLDLDLNIYKHNLSDTTLKYLIQKIASGNFAIESPIYRYQGKESYVEVSKSIFQFGILKLLKGELVNDTVLALNPDIYPLQKVTKIGIVRGIIESKWVKNFQTDTLLYKVKQNNLRQISNPDATFYLKDLPIDQIHKVKTILETNIGKKLEILPLVEYLLQDLYGIQQIQNKFNLFISTLLILVVFLFFILQITLEWRNNFEIYRIERMLGRSKSYFVRKWILSVNFNWIAGYFISLFLILATSALFSMLNQTQILLILTHFALFGALQITLVYFSAFYLTRVSIAKKATSAKRSIFYRIMPGIFYFLFSFSFALSLGYSIDNWLESERFINFYGKKQIEVVTTNTSIRQLSKNDCVSINLPCGVFGQSNVFLWSKKYNISDLNYNSIVGIDNFKKNYFKIKVLQGRLPLDNSNELILSQEVYDTLRTKYPDFKLGTLLNFGFKVVGVFDKPLYYSNSPFNYAFVSDVYLSFKNKLVSMEKIYSPPLGFTGLNFTYNNVNDLLLAKKTLRKSISDLEFYQRSDYYAETVDAYRIFFILQACMWLMMTIMFYRILYILIKNSLIDDLDYLLIKLIQGLSKRSVKSSIMKNSLLIAVTASLFGTLFAIYIGKTAFQITSLTGMTSLGLVGILLAVFIASYCVVKTCDEFLDLEIANIYNKLSMLKN